jgi:hypothetical protein
MTEKVGRDDWQRLYEAADDFKKSGCWEWMYDDDVFGVKDPKSGEIAYCCIMGNAGENFGIAAYLGEEGFRVLHELLSGAVDPYDSDYMYRQNSLLCTFDDRETLASEDLKLIKELGLKYRGRNQWPCFRHLSPGLYPWFLDAAQCRFLTHILRQALDVALRCKQDKSILDHKTPLTYLVRVPETAGDGMAWADRYLTEEITPEGYRSYSLNNDVVVKKISNTKTNKSLALEAGIFFMPAPVREKGRPYYPRVCVLVDHAQGIVVSYEMFKDLKNEGYKCIEMLIGFILENGVRPAKILVAGDEAYYTFFDACRQFDIELKKVRRLKFINEVRNGMAGNLMW